MGILLNKVHNILYYDAGQFYVKKQDGGRIKICETFSGNSLKEDLSIDTTFDPCLFFMRQFLETFNNMPNKNLVLLVVRSLNLRLVHQ